MVGRTEWKPLKIPHPRPSEQIKSNTASWEELQGLAPPLKDLKDAGVVNPAFPSSIFLALIENQMDLR